MRRAKIVTFLFVFLFLTAATSLAQFPIIIGAEQLKSHMRGGQKTVLIDARPAVEYQQAHIPGAINIPPELMKEKRTRLPKNKKTPLIFYCRGEG
jgi:rhodanese-related sulfurtransferase